MCQNNAAIVEENKLTVNIFNVRLAAIRSLAREAQDNGLLDPVIAMGIARVQGALKSGRRIGNWLNKQQAQKLLNAPELTRPDGQVNMKAYRDRVVLAVMIGTGLRRAEVVSLTFNHIQQREGRWVIVDLVGKRKHVRSIPIPAFVKVAIDEWSDVSGIREGLIIRAVQKGGAVTSGSISPQAILYIVQSYGEAIGERTWHPMICEGRSQSWLTRAAPG